MRASRWNCHEACMVFFCRSLQLGPVQRPIVADSSELPPQVFVPPTADELVEDWQQTWVVRVAKLAATLTIGWPLYLFFNVSGRKYDAWPCTRL